jgi:List-Bact-rpt repeat protein
MTEENSVNRTAATGSRIRAFAVAIVLACPLGFAQPAFADSFLVDSFGTGGDVNAGDNICDADAGATVECTLRAAVEQANSTVAGDTVHFQVTGTHTVLSQISITNPITIVGNGDGPAGTIVDGVDSTRLFTIQSAADGSEFDNIRLQHGRISTAGTTGGAAVLTDAALTLTGVTVTQNEVTGTGTSSGSGAGIFNTSSGDLVINGSTITGNTLSTTSVGHGAGIASQGPLSLIGSTVSLNEINTAADEQHGAGIFVSGGFDIGRSTISGNTTGAIGAGGGLFNDAGAGARNIGNSTVSGNTAGSGGGGGLEVQGSSPVGIDFVTLVDNHANVGTGPDLRVIGGSTNVRNSILASASGACDTEGAGTIGDGGVGHDIDAGTSCGFGTTNGNQENTDPLLGLLGDNGGGTATHALSLDSPALDAAVPGCGSLFADQRTIIRPQGPACDIGSFELDYRTLAVSTTGSGTVTGTGINCPGDCGESVPDGTQIALTPAAAGGFSFTGWSGDCAGTGACLVSLNANRAVTGNFTADQLPPPSTQPAPGVAPTAPKKHCKKGQKLKKGKCVKKKHRK